MKIKTTLLMLVLGLIISTSGFAKVYKWTDANGKTHYTATPPPSKTKVLAKEEFKVRKTPKSSLRKSTNYKSDFGDENVSSIKKTTVKSKSKTKHHAREQCSKAIRKSPALVRTIKKQLKQAIKAGRVPESKMNEFNKLQSAGEFKAPSMNKCIQNYMTNGASETDNIADNSSADAISYMQMQSAFGKFSK